METGPSCGLVNGPIICHVCIVCLKSSWLEKYLSFVAFADFIKCIKEKLKGTFKETQVCHDYK